MSPTFANVQELLITWLRTELALQTDPLEHDALVAEDVPPGWAGSPALVVVRRSGGPAEWPVIDLPRVDFLCRADTEYNAQKLAATVRGLIVYTLKGCILQGRTVYRIREFSGPTRYPDPAGSPVPLVMFTEEIRIRVV
jgi:hypothetical protein